jgi:RimJ/RimL family protein N-acetyltransferase
MNYQIKSMDKELAASILKWKYDVPYDIYNNELTQEGINELLENNYYAVMNQNDSLIGFFCIGNAAQVPIGNKFDAYKLDFIDIGLGLRPDLTGKGNGGKFLEFILNYIVESFEQPPLRLTVAKFNSRAIRLYEKFGFINQQIEFSNGKSDFITMVKI